MRMLFLEHLSEEGLNATARFWRRVVAIRKGRGSDWAQLLKLKDDKETRTKHASPVQL
jgi:hypothetical protein